MGRRVFFTFAGWGGWKGSLSINEFKELVTQRLTHLLKVVSSLDEKMKGLDENQELRSVSSGDRLQNWQRKRGRRKAWRSGRSKVSLLEWGPGSNCWAGQAELQSP
ncbi:Protein S100-A13 [Lemmus lemmus]